MNKKQKRAFDVMSHIEDDVIERVSVKRFRLLTGRHYKRKKTWIPVLSAAACLVLIATVSLLFWKHFGTDDPFGAGGQIPVYTGMTVSSEYTAQSQTASVDVALPLQFLGNNNGNNGNENGNNGNHGNTKPQFPPNSPPIEDAVKSSLTVTGSSEPIYYAQTGQDIYITVHIDNPDDFVILSFMLNGKTYSSYMFEEGSDMENLVLKVNVGDANGEVLDYTIDAIKYVEGTEIKDVRMEGEQTVRVGVGTEQQPTSQITEELVGIHNLSFTVTVTDPKQLIAASEGKLYAVLYDGETVIAPQELTVGEAQTVTFDGLATNAVYQYAIVAMYDALDGQGKTVHILYENTVQTPEYVAFGSVTVTTDSLKYSYVWGNGATQELSALTLYEGETKVRDLTPTDVSLNGLLSGRTYRLVATYSNQGVTEYAEVIFTTKAKVQPTVILSATATKEKISFTIDETDPDKIGAITKIELLHGNDTPVELSDLTKREFTGLLSNNDYAIKLTYVYDLNDGRGKQELIVTKNIKTIAKAMPNLNLTATAEQEKIDFAIDVTDPDAIGSITKIELLHGNDAPIVLTDLTKREFTELLSDNDYTVKVTYTYDLNNGNGAQELVVTKNLKTKAKAVPSMTVTATAEQEKIDFVIDVTDPDAIGSITKIELLHGNDAPIVLTDLTKREFTELLSDNDYTVKVTYTYDLNDGNGAQELVVTKNIKTIAKAMPNLNLTATATQEEVEFVVTVTDPDAIGSITKIELLHGNDAPIVLTDLTKREFTDLLSDNDYTVKVTYTYDLNDGNGAQELVVTKNLKTKAKAVPTVSIYAPEDNSIGLNWTDPDQVRTVEKIEILLGETVVQTLTNQDVSVFENLKKNTEYRIRMTYTYDLNDGMGSHRVIFEDGQFTKKGLTKSQGLQMDENGVIVGMGSCTDTVLYLDAPVAREAFLGRNITAVYFSHRVTTIGASAFEGCASLQSIYLSYGVTDMEWKAFMDCIRLSVVEFGQDSKLTQLYTWVFAGCTSLVEITIPDSVEYMSSTFENAMLLTTVNFGENSQLQRLGHSVFEGCISLERIDLPDGIICIENNTFLNSGYYLNASNWENGALYLGPYLLATKAEELASEYQVKEETTLIARRAFEENQSLTSISFPDSVRYIGLGAFRNCSSLKTVHIESLDAWLQVEAAGEFPQDFDLYVNGVPVTHVEISAEDRLNTQFQGCATLESVEILSGVTSIPARAFKNCKRLQSISLPDTITEIGDQAFYGCEALNSVTLPNQLTHLGYGAFYNCSSLQSIKIPDGVTEIAEEMFTSCASLITVELPEGLKTIGIGAFANCRVLQNINFPDSLTVILDSAFSSCTNLKDIELPSGLIGIGPNAFSNTSYYNDETNWTDGALYLGTYLIAAKDVSTIYQIRSGTTLIACQAFLTSNTIVQVEIPVSVQYINLYAFYCGSLRNIVFSGTVAQWNAIEVMSAGSGTTSVICSDGIAEFTM